MGDTWNMLQDLAYRKLSSEEKMTENGQKQIFEEIIVKNFPDEQKTSNHRFNKCYEYQAE